MTTEKETARRSRDPYRRNDERGPYERDWTKLIHSAAFRRLQAKTQVLGIGEGDFHRTRLTHSLEVAQIARGIVRNLYHRSKLSKNFGLSETLLRSLLEEDLIMFIGLGHDLGHPPFGHGGEAALNYCMRQHGGFEGNGQTLRILSTLEAHTKDYGLNPTRRSILGILKYPINYTALRKLSQNDNARGVCNRLEIRANDWKPPKCYHEDEKPVVEWILKPLSQDDRNEFIRFVPPTETDHGKATEKSLDASIVDIADDIAYGIHDLEDAIVLSLITSKQWRETENSLDKNWMEEHGLKGSIKARLFGDRSARKRMIGGLVHAFITNTQIVQKQVYQSPLLRFNVEFKDRIGNTKSKNLAIISNLVQDKVIHIPEVETLEYRGQQIVIQLFEAIASDPRRFLKGHLKEKLADPPDPGQDLRIVCDYVSGMTDEYATRLYERLFMPRHGTVFHKL